MADTVTTITNLVNSPPGQFAAGGVLAGIVWKFFEQVEGLLRENTRLEIAGWLMDIRVGRHIPRWQSALPVYFRLVCGPRYSRRRLYVVLCMSLVSFLTAYSPIVLAFRVLRNPPLFSSQVAFDLLVFVSCSVQSLLILLLIDEILLEGEDKVQMYKPVISMLILIGLATLVISCTYVLLLPEEYHQRLFLKAALHDLLIVRIITAMVLSSSWLWLFAGSGFILKAARRFDIGFEWFNRKFDVEKKPLQSIGVVAGALVALLYWTAAIIRHFVSWAAMTAANRNESELLFEEYLTGAGLY